MGWMKKVKRAAKRPYETAKKAIGGVKGGKEDDARSEAAQRLVRGAETRQAGSGAITYNEEHLE